jgi:hypothetical protein
VKKYPLATPAGPSPPASDACENLMLNRQHDHQAIGTREKALITSKY